MSAAASRRTVLKYGGGGALALLIGGVAGWADRRDPTIGEEAAAPTTTTTTLDPCEREAIIVGIGAIDAGILVLGEAAIEAHGWSDLDELLAAVPDPSVDPLAQAAAITRDEFRGGDTVRIDGWVLARSEARAAAALALMDRASSC